MSAVPQRIDRYLIERELGRGSFGAVYKARHSVIGRDVALKVLHPERATSPSVLERFLGEARAVAAIGSPHIVQVFDAGLTPDGKAFLAMELLEGEDLAQHLARKGRLSPGAAVSIAREVLLGLAAAHRAGVVHRDLKPANIFLARASDGSLHAKVLDFGISKIARPEGEELTMTGTMLGTPHYMSPEQLSNSRGVDGRTDLYAVGTVLYEMLSASLPYDGTTLASLIASKMSDAPRPLSVPEVPGAVATAVLRSLAWDPNARFATADQMEQALATAMAGRPSDPAWSETRPSHRGAEGTAPTEMALSASGASTLSPPISRPPSHPTGPVVSSGPTPSFAQSSIVSLPGIVNATAAGTLTPGTTQPPFKRLLAVVGVGLTLAVLAVAGLAGLAVVAYLSSRGEAPAASTGVSPSAPAPAMPAIAPAMPAAGPTEPPSIGSAPSVGNGPAHPRPEPPPGALSPAPGPTLPPPSAGPASPPDPPIASPSASGGRVRIASTVLGMDAATADELARRVRPDVEACRLRAGYRMQFQTVRMLAGGAVTHASITVPDPDPAATRCVEDAFAMAGRALPGGNGIARFTVTSE